MSVRRLALTSAAMAGVAFLLGALTPDLGDLMGLLLEPQRTADIRGADALVLAVGGLAAWLVWAWGALGLALTATSAAPGLLGSAARLLVRVVLPAGARRTAALALGVGLGVAVPVLFGPHAGRPVLVAAVEPVAMSAAVPDWPASAPGPVPDWPGEAPPDAHVVVRGDCLWAIAAGRLTSGTPATDAAIATAVHAWWTTNADVIGADPDLILPGQVLQPPAQP